MISQNEYYLLNKLECKIEEWLDEELSGDHDLGFLPDNLVRNMADAAWIVCRANKDVNDYMDKNRVTHP